MQTYLQLYEGVLRKLDKFGSPDFDIPDFNMFMNQAIRNVLTPALDYAETNQKTTDNIRNLMARVAYSKTPASNLEKKLTADGGELPANYYHLRKRAVTVTFKLLKPYGRHSTGKTITATATRVDGDQSVSTRDNYFLRASVRDPHFRVINNLLQVFPAPSEYWEPVKVEAEYFMEPPTVQLDEDTDGGPTEESGSKRTIFPDYLDDQFIEECVRLSQRSTGDERVQVNPGANPSFLS